MNEPERNALDLISAERLQAHYFDGGRLSTWQTQEVLRLALIALRAGEAGKPEQACGHSDWPLCQCTGICPRCKAGCGDAKCPMFAAPGAQVNEGRQEGPRNRTTQGDGPTSQSEPDSLSLPADPSPAAREDQIGWGRIPELEKTRLGAMYWENGARAEPDRERALIALHQSVNHWKNAAYAMADKLAALTAERAPGADKGPWSVRDVGERFPVLFSDDFTHDVTVRFTGDFGSDEDKRAYAEWLVSKLKLTAPQPDLAGVRTGLRLALDIAKRWQPTNTMADIREVLERPDDKLADLAARIGGK